MITVPANEHGIPYEPIPEGRPTLFNGNNLTLYVFDDYDEYNNFMNNPVFSGTSTTDIIDGSTDDFQQDSEII
jgi:hypothetical protein